MINPSDWSVKAIYNESFHFGQGTAVAIPESVEISLRQKRRYLASGPETAGDVDDAEILKHMGHDVIVALRAAFCPTRAARPSMIIASIALHWETRLLCDEPLQIQMSREDSSSSETNVLRYVLKSPGLCIIPIVTFYK